jgi:hypothetical protein
VVVCFLAVLQTAASSADEPSTQLAIIVAVIGLAGAIIGATATAIASIKIESERSVREDRRNQLEFDRQLEARYRERRVESLYMFQDVMNEALHAHMQINITRVFDPHLPRHTPEVVEARALRQRLFQLGARIDDLALDELIEQFHGCLTELLGATPDNINEVTTRREPISRALVDRVRVLIRESLETRAG